LDLITHVHSSLSTHASFLTNQTGSKCGPTLQVSSVVLPFITSGPLRLPCAPNMSLTGFTQLDTRLPPSEYGWRRRDLRSYFRYLSPHAIGLTPGPLQVPMPFASLQSLAFSLTQEDRRLFRLARIHPPSGLSRYSRPVKTHGAAPFALCYGLRFWLAPLAG